MRTRGMDVACDPLSGKLPTLYSGPQRKNPSVSLQGGNSIALKKGPEKRPEKGPESKFATSICMNSKKEPGLYRFGPIFTNEISILIQ